MRALLVHPWGRLDAACCGAAHTARTLLDYFAARGWDVHVVVQEIPAWGIVGGANAVRADCPPVAPRDYGNEFRQLLYASEWAARGGAFRRIAAEPWDAVFTTDVTATAYANVLPRDMLKVLAVDDSYARRAALNEHAPRAVRDAEQRFTFARVEVELYRLFDRVLFTSDAEAADARRYGVKSAAHVPPMIGGSLASPADVSETHDLVICGGIRSGDLADLEWFYRHVYVPHLRACGVRLTVAGPVAARFAVCDRLVTKVDSIADAIHAARIVIAPACEAAGPCVPAMAALAAGRALVATLEAARGLDVPDDAAMVFDMRQNPARTADALLALLAASDRRRALGERAALAAVRHSRERHFASLDRALTVVCDAPLAGVR